MTDTLRRVKTYQQFIDGAWVDSASGETLAVENPANGEIIAHVPASGAEDVDRAAERRGEGLRRPGSTRRRRIAACSCSSSPTRSRRGPTRSAGSSRRTPASRSARRSTRSPSSSTTCASSPAPAG